MRTKTIIISISIFSFMLLTNCEPTITTYKPKKVNIGSAIQFSEFLKKNSSAKVFLKKINSADWEIHRSGLIYLDHPKAKEQNLIDGLEPINIFMYVLDHPTKGRVIIDSGVGSLYRQPLNTWPVPEALRVGLSMDKLKIVTSTKEYFTQDAILPKSVFLTHLHLDHSMGLSDLSPEIPVYIGPNEASSRHKDHRMFQEMTDKLLGENRNLQELKFPSIDSTLGISIIDFFEDGSLLLFHAPGHTAGSLAFLVNSQDGPELILGDNCHTAWGWKNNVPPGSFTEDTENNIKSLSSLKKIEELIPGIKIHPGHQNF
jgi:N-acyl homoserine lactone hydrolase